jgi:hypothetical protein
LLEGGHRVGELDGLGGDLDDLALLGLEVPVERDLDELAVLHVEARFGLRVRVICGELVYAGRKLGQGEASLFVADRGLLAHEHRRRQDDRHARQRSVVGGIAKNAFERCAVGAAVEQLDLETGRLLCRGLCVRCSRGAPQRLGWRLRLGAARNCTDEDCRNTPPANSHAGALAEADHDCHRNVRQKLTRN